MPWSSGHSGLFMVQKIADSNPGMGLLATRKLFVSLAGNLYLFLNHSSERSGMCIAFHKAAMLRCAIYTVGLQPQLPL